MGAGPVNNSCSSRPDYRALSTNCCYRIPRLSLFGYNAGFVPGSVTFDWDGRVLAVCQEQHRIVVLNRDGSLVRLVGAGPGALAGQLAHPTAVCVNQRAELIVVDWNHRVNMFAADGLFIGCFGGKGNGSRQLSHPMAVLSDEQHRVIVADAANNRLQYYTSSGQHTRTIDVTSPTTNRPQRPLSLAINSHGHLLVVAGGRVRLFDDQSQMWLLDFNPLESISGMDQNRSADRSKLKQLSVAVDSYDGIVVASASESKLLFFDADGKFVCRFGGFGRFLTPRAVAVNNVDGLAVADSQDHCIQLIDPPSESGSVVDEV